MPVQVMSSDWTLELEEVLALAEDAAIGPEYDFVSIGLVPDEAATSRTSWVDGSSCWGSELHGAPLPCDQSFTISGIHLKDKFCPSCRENGVLVPAHRIRAISDDHKDAFSNSPSGGLWNVTSALNGLAEYRVINHTRGCTKPLLLVFREVIPPSSEDVNAGAWTTLPAAWLHHGTHIKLWPSKGTLVPTRPRTRPQYGLRLPAKRPRPTAHLPALMANLPMGELMRTGEQQLMGSSGNGTEGRAHSTADPMCVSMGNPTGVSPVSPARWGSDSPSSSIELRRDSPSSSIERTAAVSADGSEVRGVDEAGSDGLLVGGGDVHGGDAGGGSTCAADTHSVTEGHSAFVTRFVAAHANLQELLETRLRSSEPLPPEQHEVLLEQVCARVLARPGAPCMHQEVRHRKAGRPSGAKR